MSAGIAITREDLTAAELRSASSKAGSIRAARRMLALALVLEGGPDDGGAQLRDGSPDAARLGAAEARGAVGAAAVIGVQTAAVGAYGLAVRLGPAQAPEGGLGVLVAHPHDLSEAQGLGAGGVEEVLVNVISAR